MVDVFGNIQADGDAGGGWIDVTAGGDINIYSSGAKGIEASGTTANADGGQIDLTSGGSILVNDPVRVNYGGGSGEAGGGHITMRAANDITVTTGGGKIFADGRQSDAGEIHLTAGHDISITASASVTADGHSVGGNGGGIYLTATNAVVLGASVSARGGMGSGGSEATGGTLEIESGCGGVTISSDLDLRGGEFGGGYNAGSLNVDTLGDLTVSGGVLIDTHAVGNGGSGGDIVLESGGKITIGANATLDARGDTSDPDGDGFAGSIMLNACDVEVGSGAALKASGLEGGIIVLESGSQLRDTRTLHVAGSSTIDASGSIAGLDGSIRVAVTHESLTGTCSTDPNRSCTLDTDCTVGCTPGECDGLNPDTDDVLTQFVTTPEMEEDRNLAACQGPCIQ